VFTLPHCEQVDGTVTSTRPFSFGGGMIEGARLTFEAGRVVDFSAARGGEVLRKVLEVDEGARRLGEVALVPNSSPVSQSGLVFGNILYDENASCHFALGEAYRISLCGGVDMTDEAFRAAGGNASDVHLDFMVGSAELDIDGVCADGSVEPVLRQGEWALD
jgi:aminopeptidase